MEKNMSNVKKKKKTPTLLMFVTVRTVILEMTKDILLLTAG